MRQRWSVAVLGIAAVLLFGYVATHRDPVQRPDPPGAAATTEPGLPRVAGNRGPGPKGMRLLISGQYPQIIDAVTGHSSPVPGVQLSAGERGAVQLVPAGTVVAETAPGTSRVRTTLVPTTGARRPIVLGDNVVVVPASRGADLYVARRGIGSTRVTITAPSGAARSSWTAAGTLTPLRDTAAGLVVQLVGDRGVSELRLVDPRTGATRRRLTVGGVVVAVGPSSPTAGPAATRCRGAPATRAPARSPRTAAGSRSGCRVSTATAG
jgi:hypothetical protein